MSNKVELKLEDYTALTRKIESLEKELKELKSIQNKVEVKVKKKGLTHGQVRYDRILKKNVFQLLDEEYVEEIVYISFDEIKQTLHAEIEDTISNNYKSKFTKKDNQISKLKKENVQLKEDLKTLNDDNEKLQNDYTNLVNDDRVKQKDQEIDRLLDEIDYFKNKESSLNVKIEELEKTNMTIFNKLPFWVRNKYKNA